MMMEAFVSSPIHLFHSSCWYGVQHEIDSEKELIESYEESLESNVSVIKYQKLQIDNKDKEITNLNIRLQLREAEHLMEIAAFKMQAARNAEQVQAEKEKSDKVITKLKSRYQKAFDACVTVSTTALAPECILFNGLVTNKLCLKYDH